MVKSRLLLKWIRCGLNGLYTLHSKKCHKIYSFLPKHSNSSLIRALFTLVGVGINFKPLDKKEISALEKILADKLMMFGLTNLPFNCLFVLEKKSIF